MRWPRRSPWRHDSDHIEYLNTKFQLRIPMNSKSTVSMNKVSPLPDDSTACSSISCDSSVSSVRTVRRQVHFCEEIVEFQPPRKVLTEADIDILWFNRSELSEIKSTFRRIYNREYGYDTRLKEAANRVQRLFSRQNLHVLADSDNDEASEADCVSRQVLYYLDAARILGRDDARGLERFHYGTTIVSNSSVRWQHIQKYVAAVLDAQKLAWNCPLESRAAFIAAKCHSLPSVVWGLASADADEEAVSVLFESLEREFLEV